MNDRKQTDTEFVAALFEELPDVEPSANLRRKLAQIPIGHPREAFSWWPFGQLWQPALGLAALALLGVVTGRGLGAQNVTAASVATSPLFSVGKTADAPPSRAPEPETWNDDELDELFESALFEGFDEQWNDEPEATEDAQ